MTIALCWDFLFLQDDIHNRCSISADSQIENSGSDESTEDEQIDIKDNGFHDAENEVDPEDDDDSPLRSSSGKLCESSGYVGSDLYDYKVLMFTNFVYLTHFLFSLLVCNSCN